MIFICHLCIDDAEDIDCDSKNAECSTQPESYHNEFIKQEFARQSQTFYEAAKVYKTDNLTPLINAANIKSTDIILDVACGPGLITTECAKQNPQKVYDGYYKGNVGNCQKACIGQ